MAEHHFVRAAWLLRRHRTDIHRAVHQHHQFLDPKSLYLSRSALAGDPHDQSSNLARLPTRRRPRGHLRRGPTRRRRQSILWRSALLHHRDQPGRLAMTRKCYDTDYVEQRYAARPPEYRLAMESAIIERTPERICYDADSDG